MEFKRVQTSLLVQLSQAVVTRSSQCPGARRGQTLTEFGDIKIALQLLSVPAVGVKPHADRCIHPVIDRPGLDWEKRC